MKKLTVRQLAGLSGVTVRTLHYYGEIGLLKPASIGANGYRYYGRQELLRLQRILFHRELGVPLAAIAGLLELEGEDQIAVLRQHRARLEAQREHYRILIQTIDRTIADLAAGGPLAHEELYRGFSAEKQAGYQAWLIERYGEGMRERIAHSSRDNKDNKTYARLAPAEQGQLQGVLRELEHALAQAMRRGFDPGCPAVDVLIGRHRAWVAAMWGRDCPRACYAGLADLYLSHPDFVARYERLAPGFSDYLTRAMKRHAQEDTSLRLSRPR